MKIKALNWEPVPGVDRDAVRAKTVLGDWEVWKIHGGKVYGTKPEDRYGIPIHLGFEEAKAYMEADYEKRVRACLEE